MTFLIISCAALCVIGLLLRSRKGTAKTARPGSGKGAKTSEERHAIRRRIVQEAARLHELESLGQRLAEGSDSGIHDDAARTRAERMRLEAVRLRNALEGECVRHGLPIGLVRHNRTGSNAAIVRTPGSD